MYERFGGQTVAEDPPGVLDPGRGGVFFGGAGADGQQLRFLSGGGPEEGRAGGAGQEAGGGQERFEDILQ